jgi:dTDP-glucose 4,6-dehydratase
MNLLVTGGAGFIGSHVIRHVIDRPEVVKVVNLDALTYAGHLETVADVAGHPKYCFEQVDLRDRAAVERVIRQHAITHVLHLAAESHVDRSITGPADFIQTNVVGTFHLLEACRLAWQLEQSRPGAAGPGYRFHHVSTDEVYGSAGPEGAFAESAPYAPSSPYAASKAAADLLVRAYHRTYRLPVVISNCSNNYGPYQFPEKLIPVVIQCALNRRPIPVYGDGLYVRDWIHVSDHVRALWLVLTQGREGDTYHISADQQCTNLELVERICDLVDELAPERGGQSRRLITFVQDRPGHDRRYALDASKLRRELGWAPTCSFDRGLRETVQWYLTHQHWVKTVLAKARTNSAPCPA